ncbi:HASPIN protein kinase [Kwoniella heveanensis CBS 569]|nr:HASPIN protein kinase [Kwoniella heveanensis CBS 569]
MSHLGGKTKKVTTYGRKKNQIISVHSDLSAPIPPSPLAVKAKPPVLQSKLSSDISNIPSTPLPPAKHNGKKASLKILESPLSSPEFVYKAHKVHRPGRKIIPRSPSCSPVKIETPRREVIDAVVLPIRSAKRIQAIFEEKPRDKTKQKKKKQQSGGLGDLAKKLKEVSIQDEVPLEPETILPKEDAEANLNAALSVLLQSCNSATVSSFDTFLKGDDLPKYGSLTKVGEASYSEVFGLTNHMTGEIDYVLKVVPLLTSALSNGLLDVPMPDCSRIEDVSREVEVTKRMSQVPGGGFVGYIGSYVVEGEYPELLLRKWDEYKSTLGSASVRPSVLPSSQKYCLLVLNNAGTDLETFKFSSSTGWLQAAGVFWQIASSLARAEEWTHFEHRDLHQGQILISVHASESDVASSDYLNPLVSGVHTTVIDFGLSRLSGVTAASQSEPLWSELPAEVYEGKGAQWDVYRSMRDRVERDGEWPGFHPITNVMWLHYIARYITSKLRPPKPPTRRSSRLTALYVRLEEAYLMLSRVEKVLAWSVDFPGQGQTRRGLRGAAENVLDTKFESAETVLEWGRKEGWVATA